MGFLLTASGASVKTKEEVLKEIDAVKKMLFEVSSIIIKDAKVSTGLPEDKAAEIQQGVDKIKERVDSILCDYCDLNRDQNIASELSLLAGSIDFKIDYIQEEVQKFPEDRALLAFMGLNACRASIEDVLKGGIPATPKKQAIDEFDVLTNGTKNEKLSFLFNLNGDVLTDEQTLKLIKAYEKEKDVDVSAMLKEYINLKLNADSFIYTKKLMQSDKKEDRLEGLLYLRGMSTKHSAVVDLLLSSYLNEEDVQVRNVMMDMITRRLGPSALIYFAKKTNDAEHHRKLAALLPVSKELVEKVWDSASDGNPNLQKFLEELRNRMLIAENKNALPMSKTDKYAIADRPDKEKILSEIRQNLAPYGEAIAAALAKGATLQQISENAKIGLTNAIRIVQDLMLCNYVVRKGRNAEEIDELLAEIEKEKRTTFLMEYIKNTSLPSIVRMAAGRKCIKIYADTGMHLKLEEMCASLPDIPEAIKIEAGKRVIEIYSQKGWDRRIADFGKKADNGLMPKIVLDEIQRIITNTSPSADAYDNKTAEITKSANETLFESVFEPVGNGDGYEKDAENNAPIKKVVTAKIPITVDMVREVEASEDSSSAYEANTNDKTEKPPLAADEAESKKMEPGAAGMLGSADTSKSGVTEKTSGQENSAGPSELQADHSEMANANENRTENPTIPGLASPDAGQALDLSPSATNEEVSLFRIETTKPITIPPHLIEMAKEKIGPAVENEEGTDIVDKMPVQQAFPFYAQAYVDYIYLKEKNGGNTPLSAEAGPIAQEGIMSNNELQMPLFEEYNTNKEESAERQADDKIRIADENATTPKDTTKENATSNAGEKEHAVEKENDSGSNSESEIQLTGSESEIQLSDNDNEIKSAGGKEIIDKSTVPPLPKEVKEDGQAFKIDLEPVGKPHDAVQSTNANNVDYDMSAQKSAADGTSERDIQAVNEILLVLSKCFMKEHASFERTMQLTKAVIDRIHNGEKVTANDIVDIAIKERIPFLLKKEVKKNAYEIDRALLMAYYELPHKKVKKQQKVLKWAIAIAATIAIALSAPKAYHYAQTAYHTNPVVQKTVESASSITKDAINKIEKKIRDTQKLGNKAKKKAKNVRDYIRDKLHLK
ncbi:MAG: hypothetical protein QXS93_03420 [Candidatus Micrarchaeia archaeon]